MDNMTINQKKVTLSAGHEVLLCRHVCFDLTQVQQIVSFYRVDVWGKAKENSHTSFILCISTSLCNSITSWTDIKGSIRNAWVYRIFPHSSLCFISAIQRWWSCKKNTITYCAAYRWFMQSLHVEDKECLARTEWESRPSTKTNWQIFVDAC